MNDFAFYFTEGWNHIISRDALDHQLFILALVINYTLSDWKKVLVLVTAFTIGHSATLVLSVLNIVRINSNWVEFLIPVTIVITAAQNIFAAVRQKKNNTSYFLALGFGLIHGLGFANSIRLMLASDQSIAVGLLGFNLGLEAGQIALIAFILLVAKLLRINKISRKAAIITVSLIILVASAGIAAGRIPS